MRLLDKLNIVKLIPHDPTIYWISHGKVVKQYEVDQNFASMCDSTNKMIEVFKELMGMK